MFNILLPEEVMMNDPDIRNSPWEVSKEGNIIIQTSTGNFTIVMRFCQTYTKSYMQHVVNAHNINLLTGLDDYTYNDMIYKGLDIARLTHKA